MGANSSKYNIVKEYSKKSMKELSDIDKEFTDAVARYPQHKIFNEHLQFVKMCIAERIGTKYVKNQKFMSRT